MAWHQPATASSSSGAQLPYPVRSDGEYLLYQALKLSLNTLAANFSTSYSSGDLPGGHHLARLSEGDITLDGASSAIRLILEPY
jgi:hypothetical protein